MPARRSFYLALLSAALVAGWSAAAPAEDEVATSTKVFKGKVVAADTSGVTIEIPGMGKVVIPRTQIVKLTVEQPPSVKQGIEDYEKGNLKGAQMSLGKVMLQYEGLDVAWAAKGMVYFGRASLAFNDYANAEKAFNAFLKAYPDHPLGLNASIGLAEIEISKKNYDAALPKLRELAEHFDKQLKPPKNELNYAAEIYLGIGKCLEGQGQLDEAVAAYLQVPALYPAEAFYPEALYRAARIFIQQDKLDKAEGLLTELIEDYPASELARKALEDKSAISAKRGDKKEK